MYNRSKEVNLLFLILFLSISLLLIAAFFVTDKFNQANNDFQGVSQSNETLIHIHNVESALFATGSSVRFYLLTRKSSVTDSLHQNYYRVKAEIDSIGESSLQYHSQLYVLDSLRVLIDTRFKLWEELISLPEDASSSASNELSVEGNKVSAQIFTITTGLKAKEYGLLKSYIVNTQSGIKTTTMLIAGAAFFGIALILFAFFKLSVEIKRGIDGQIQLQTKIQELDRSNAELQQFAYTASHDLQEPLRKLHAFSERLIMRDKENISSDGQEIIGKMQGFVARMQRLIDDLLTFSRNLNNTTATKRIELNKTLNDVKQIMSDKITETETQIEADNLPSIAGFESQLQQLFQNLISNSIKYAQKGIPPFITIKISMVKGDIIKGVKPIDIKKHFYKIVFSDNGIGFDNKYSEKIFLIFQRLHGKSEYEGTGIGLATCKVVMENHRGYITANGIEGVGADFTIYFPVV